jgi:hypothetical protein
MMIVAGSIEGFFSPSSVAAGLKFLVAAAVGIVFVIYLASGRTRDALLRAPEQQAKAAGA